MTAPILCVDIGGTSTKVGVLQGNGTLHHVRFIPTQPPVDSFLDNLTSLLTETQATAAKGNGKPCQLGVAVAGFLDDECTKVIYNPNLPWLESYPLKDRLQQRFPALAIALEVDSNAATVAEYQFGSGQGSRRFLCLTCGTGLGVGMTIDGVPLRFAYGCMGDIGHTVVQRDGPLCTCGGRGCAEALLAAPNLARQYQELTDTGGTVTLRDVIAASQRGDAAALSILTAAGEWLGIAMASMANTFFPDHIAIAGGLSAAGDVLLQPAERVFRQTACTLAGATATVSPATLGPSATLIGAACPFWSDKIP